jgi:hypothetical protein
MYTRYMGALGKSAYICVYRVLSPGAFSRRRALFCAGACGITLTQIDLAAGARRSRSRRTDGPSRSDRRRRNHANRCERANTERERERRAQHPQQKLASHAAARSSFLIALIIMERALGLSRTRALALSHVAVI